VWIFLPSHDAALYASTALTIAQTRVASRVLRLSTDLLYSEIGLQIQLGVSDTPG